MYTSDKNDWRKLTVVHMKSKLQHLAMANWQRFVAYRKKFTYMALYNRRTLVLKSAIITKQQEEFVDRDEMPPPPSSPLPTILSSPSSYPQNCAAHSPICSPFTPPYCEAKAEKEVRDLLNIIQVDSIEDLKCLLWKLRSFNFSKKDVVEKKDDVTTAQMTSNAMTISLWEAQGKNAMCSEDLGSSSDGGVKNKCGIPKLGKAEWKIKKAKQLMATPTCWSNSSRYLAPQ
jgi:hypothetical protein